MSTSIDDGVSWQFRNSVRLGRRLLGSPRAMAAAAWSLRLVSFDANCLGSIGRSVDAAFRRKSEASLTAVVSPCSSSSGPLSRGKKCRRRSGNSEFAASGAPCSLNKEGCYADVPGLETTPVPRSLLFSS
ncbi:hypothetical protein MRS44_017842 [Fusarium solani]|uniref:uncharacterized protein n=1 Tax=Fusarium solani TaxID=169388 RepID=UPI0032C47E79|nr:hypothetical protein MRS44_017842 [Fusarium solani]